MTIVSTENTVVTVDGNPSRSKWRCPKCRQTIKLLVRIVDEPNCSRCGVEMLQIEGPDTPFSSHKTPGQRLWAVTLNVQSGRSGPRNVIGFVDGEFRRLHTSAIAGWSYCSIDGLRIYFPPGRFAEMRARVEQKRGGRLVRRVEHVNEPTDQDDDQYDDDPDDDPDDWGDWIMRRRPVDWTERTDRRHRKRVHDAVANERRRRPGVDPAVIVDDVRARFADGGRLIVTTCAECGEQFEAKRSTARYCTPACKTSHHRKVTS